MPRKKNAFTLIELLVVIAIIALLLSIMIPALQKAKQRTMGMVCISNQRQALLATTTYGMDNDDYNIPSWAQTSFIAPVPEHWYTFIKPYYDDTKEMLHCPMAKKPKEAIAAGIGAYGTATMAWFASPIVHTQNDRDHFGGFSYNNWLEYDFRGLDEAILKRNKVRQPAAVPVFGDGAWADNGWVLETDTIPEPIDRQDPMLFSPVPGYLKRFCLDRHDDAINMAFLDGHTEVRVDIDDLLKFRWHKKWRNQSITP